MPYADPPVPPKDIAPAPGPTHRLWVAIGPCFAVAIVAGSRALFVVGLAVAIVVGTALTVLRFVDPPTSTLMLSQRLAGIPVRQQWTPLARISPHMIRAAIAAEDTQFCSHRGIDIRELEAALEKAERTGDDVVRGASTIPMQVAKNLFLWPGRSYARKGLELALAPSLDLLWPKARTLEIYLNIVEWGPGVFGAEAAAQYHFRKPAARLTAGESALLAAALPNPIERSAGRPNEALRRIARIVEARVRSPAMRFGCVLPGEAKP